MSTAVSQLEPLTRLSRDLRTAASTLGSGEARTLVDLYYQLQDFRIQAGNQDRQLLRAEEPHETVQFFHGQFKHLEDDIRKALDTYSASLPLGQWARANVGIGPVIAAGLLAHIPIERTPHPSALWKFAGLAPDQRYVKGEKRSWNARLKVLCWRMGDSFVKQSGREKCYYGHLYKQRKEKEVHKNNAVRVVSRDAVTVDPVVATRGTYGDFPAVLINGTWLAGGNCEAAAKALTERTIRDADLKATLSQGKLPDGQLDLRARRYAVKRFLVHYHQQAWWYRFGTEPPRAYVHSELGHVNVEDNPFVPIDRRKAD